MTDGLHMSPAQAAQVAGVSRWTIMRAINTHKLQAHRDNRNHWKIASDDLDRWRAHSEARTPSAHHDDARIQRLMTEVQTERRLRETAEADRDRWQAIAEKLADRSGWWVRLWRQRG